MSDLIYHQIPAIRGPAGVAVFEPGARRPQCAFPHHATLHPRDAGLPARQGTGWFKALTQGADFKAA